MADWRATPTLDGLVDYINQQIALGRIGGALSYTAAVNAERQEWRAPGPGVNAATGDHLCDYINQQIAQGKISVIPASVTSAGLGAPIDWRASAVRTGDPLCDYINQQILLGKIVGALLPPGSPVFWFDGQNIDGLGNSSLVDGQQLGTWVNGGSTGSGGNAVQATGGLRPTFKKIASAGKLKNLSSVLFTPTQWMQTANTATFAQPNTICIVALPNPGGTCVDGNDAVNRNDVLVSSSTWQLFAGTALYNSTLAATANLYHVVRSLFSGASSTIRANLVTSTAGTSPGAASLDGLSIGVAGDATAPLTGQVVEVVVYGAGTAPADGLLDAYFNTKYGSGWPQ